MLFSLSLSIYLSIYIYIYICISLSLYIYIYICTCTYTYIQTYTYIHIYVHTYLISYMPSCSGVARQAAAAGAWVFSTGGCSARGVHYTPFPLHPPLMNLEGRRRGGRCRRRGGLDGLSSTYMPYSTPL